MLLFDRLRHGMMSGMQLTRIQRNMASDQLGPYHAYGKINWSLLITGVREDGYHLLDTVMQRIDLCDEITLIPADSWSVSCSDRRAPRDASNTALVAARAYAAAAGLRDAYHIAIEKRIPVGAGLGGGSADAAAVLSALNEKYAALTEQELLALALSVGADVPFCLAGGCARCTGVGEVMAPARGGEYHLVVAGCGANLSTAAVFRHYDGLVAAEGTDVRFDPALLGWRSPPRNATSPSTSTTRRAKMNRRQKSSPNTPSGTPTPRSGSGSSPSAPAGS